MVSARGFSLVELSIVIAIIGIFAAGLLTVIDVPSQLRKARDGGRKADLLKIQSGVELYRSDQRCYPGVGTCPALPACGNPLTGGGITYMQKIPCDPTNSGLYVYTYIPNSPANGYTLRACLENSRDIDASTKTVPIATCPSTKQYEVVNP